MNLMSKLRKDKKFSLKFGTVLVSRRTAYFVMVISEYTKLITVELTRSFVTASVVRPH